MYFSNKIKEEVKEKMIKNANLAIKTYGQDINESVKVAKNLNDIDLKETNDLFEYRSVFEQIPEELRADKVLVWDTETTGFVGYIVSIALVLYSIKEDKVLEEFYIELNPQVKIEAGAIEQHKITEDMVKDAPIFADVWEEKIKPFFDKADFYVGQNLEFDLRTIARELERMQIIYPLNIKETFDTMVFSKNIVNAKGVGGRKKNATLEEIVNFFGIKLEDDTYHNALVDTKATLEVFKALLRYKKE